MLGTLHRRVSVGVIAALLVALTVVIPRPALAHDSCAIAAPVATGALGSVIAAVNVFDPVLSAQASCPEKYGDVQPQLTRDWETPEADLGRASVATLGTDAEEQARDAGRTSAPCQDGESARFFECENIDLLSHVSHAELGTERLNDIWGWTDPDTLRDYAIVGSTTGTAFVDITEATTPRVLGFMDSASFEGGDSWRDIKVYADHAYVVSEHTDHGVQVFDLTRLRDWSGGYIEYEPDAHYLGHGSAHNININEDTGFLYSVGAGPTSEQLPFQVTAGEEAFLANGAGFGGEVGDGLTGDLALVDDGSEDPTFGCGTLVDFPEDAIAIAVRGVCPFEQKAQTAEAAGASGLIVVNNAPGTIVMGDGGLGTIIPAVMISDTDGALLIDGLPTEGTIAPSPSAAPCGTGLHMIDINQPKNPTFAGCFDDHDYIHDTQCVVYDGPDDRFQDREICFNSNGISYTTLPGFNYISIVDVTDKANPVSLSRIEYNDFGYSHQGWLTEDQTFFLHGDEGDETERDINTTTRVVDVSDLTAPEVVSTFTNTTASIDHNIYTDGDFAYAANYTSGLRVYDLRELDPENPEDATISEYGYFDMYPENDDPTFEGGPWSNFPYFHQEDVVAVSSIDRGLFILRPNLPGLAEPEPGDACDAVDGASFPDVLGPPHGDNVGCIAGYGIARGFADGTYRPANGVTRDQMTAFIARMLTVGGVGLPANAPDAFDDDDGGEHEVATNQLAAAGIVEGRGDRTFAPRDEVTRGQMASFIVRALGYALDTELTPERSNPFGDTAGSPHTDNITVAAELGITTGRTASTYEPNADVRRDQMGSFLARTLEVMVIEGLELTPID